MERPNPSSSPTAERGAKLYDQKLRGLLEPAHNGKYIVIDVTTGEYEMDADHLAASDRAAAKHPGAPLYAIRVGSPSLGRMGGGSSASRPSVTATRAFRPLNIKIAPELSNAIALEPEFNIEEA